MTIRSIFALLGSVAILLNSFRPAIAAPGDPIPGATIGLEDETGNSVVAKAKTDAAGNFEFNGLKAGTYRLFLADEMSPMPGDAEQTVIPEGNPSGPQKVIRITNIRANANQLTEVPGEGVLHRFDANKKRSLQTIMIDMDGGTISGAFKIAENESPRPQDRALIDSKTADKSNGAPSGPDAWRYKLHNGEWWYYGTDEKWLIHRNGAWVP